MVLYPVQDDRFEVHTYTRGDCDAISAYRGLLQFGQFEETT